MVDWTSERSSLIWLKNINFATLWSFIWYKRNFDVISSNNDTITYVSPHDLNFFDIIGKNLPKFDFCIISQILSWSSVIVGTTWFKQRPYKNFYVILLAELNSLFNFVSYGYQNGYLALLAFNKFQWVTTRA